MKNELKSILFCTALAIACYAMPVAAQRTYSPNFSIGLKGGATFSRMSFSPSVEQNFNPGYTFGAVVRYTEEKHVGLLAELNITQRGWKEKYDPGENFSYSRSLTYLQLPVMTHIFFGPKRFKMFINLGPEIGYMIGSSISSDFNYRDISSVPNYPTKRETDQLSMDITGKFDYGIAGGIGAEWRVTPRNSLLIEGRFYYGIGNIFPSSRTDVFSASRGMSIEATVAWLFRIK